MKVAICGIRGIPACYGGFETFAEELALRLVAAGHQVAVYGRSHVIRETDRVYRGIEIRLLPAPRHKYLETPLHSLLSFLDLAVRAIASAIPFRSKWIGSTLWFKHEAGELVDPPDVVLVCNAANSPFIWLLRLVGIPVVINVDGIERKRAKWNALGRLWYRLGERCAVWFASAVVADAEVISKYYRASYGAKSTVIGYGCNPADLKLLDWKLNDHPRLGSDTADAAHALSARPSPLDVGENELLAGWGIRPGRYLLYVSRFEPENNGHVVLEAYAKLPVEIRRQLPLVMVGDAPYATAYKRRLREIAAEGVLFTGFQFGKPYRTLQKGAFLYIQATEVGGTHPALVEAMGYGNCVLANETPENVEVLASAGVFYSRNSSEHLAREIHTLYQDERQVWAFRRAACERATTRFDWAQITTDYLTLFDRIVNGIEK